MSVPRAALWHMPTPPPQRAPWGPRCPRLPDCVLHPLAQVREAYLQFMMSVATMLRADRNLPQNSDLVREDMAQVLELETQLANVRPRTGGGRGWGDQASCPAPVTTRPAAGHGPRGGAAGRHRPVPQDGPGTAPEQVRSEGEPQPYPPCRSPLSLKYAHPKQGPRDGSPKQGHVHTRTAGVSWLPGDAGPPACEVPAATSQVFRAGEWPARGC